MPSQVAEELWVCDNRGCEMEIIVTLQKYPYKGVQVTYTGSLTPSHYGQMPVMLSLKEQAYSCAQLHKMNKADLCCGINLLQKTVPPNIPKIPRIASPLDPV